MEKRNSVLMIFFLLLTVSMSAQENQSLLVDKTFTAKVGSACEETIDADGYDCAGIEIYLVLQFNKKKVAITEIDISSCGEESISYKLEYEWELINNNEIKIHYKSEEVEYKSIGNMSFKIIEETVFGYKTDWNDQIVEYKFIKHLKK